MNTHCLVSVGKVHLYQLRIIPMSPFLDDHLPSWKVIRFYFLDALSMGDGDRMLAGNDLHQNTKVRLK